MKLIIFLVGLILLCGCVEEEYHETIYLPSEPASTSSSSTLTSTSSTLSYEQLLRAWGVVPTTTSTSTTTSTTFKLKFQGNISSQLNEFNIKHPTTTTSTTLPLMLDWMLVCVEDKDCVIHYGCCPCDNPTALNKLAEGTWDKMLACPMKLKCSSGLKPCGYKAYCVNKTCVRRLE